MDPAKAWRSVWSDTAMDQRRIPKSSGRSAVLLHEPSRRQLQGLPVIRRNVAGIDLGRERHWVCAPTLEGSDREVTSFGATTGEPHGTNQGHAVSFYSMVHR